MTPPFTVVTTFAGCGGSSLGYRMAGGKVLLACEWDADAVETYRANFSTTPVFHGDVTQLSVEHVLERTGLAPGELDIFDGSPPCQGFSTNGKREFDDQRNQLFRQYVRLLRGLRPRCFVMENVSGMVKGKMKIIFAEVMRELKASGYRVACRVLNAMYFGVPQTRTRTIFIGVRSDFDLEPTHPQAQTRPPTVRQSWAGLKNDLAQRMTFEATSRTWAKMMDVRPGEKHPTSFSWHRLHWDRPSPTLDTWCGLTFWHPGEHRPITLPEARRLGSFPDDFIFTGPLKEQFKRIGNCVPPLLMKAVATHIRDTLLPHCRAVETAKRQTGMTG